MAKERDAHQELAVSRASRSFNLIGIASIAILTFALTRFMSNIHLIFPLLFPVAASYPFMDAFTTAASFVANVYLVKRKIENWYLWIIVDIIGVFLYYQKGVIFLALLYAFFLVNAFKGVYDWTKILKGYDQKV
jgi:nicotinamide mononucleotide transporter